jgi:hypothetical protein
MGMNIYACYVVIIVEIATSNTIFLLMLTCYYEIGQTSWNYPTQIFSCICGSIKLQQHYENIFMKKNKLYDAMKMQLFFVYKCLELSKKHHQYYISLQTLQNLREQNKSTLIKFSKLKKVIYLKFIIQNLF